MRNTGKSSRFYGLCEVCRQHASEVWIARYAADYIFGHQGCLVQLRDEMDGPPAASRHLSPPAVSGEEITALNLA